MDNTDQSINLILSTQSTCTLATVFSKTFHFWGHYLSTYKGVINLID
jgi:hypothetical protein